MIAATLIKLTAQIRAHPALKIKPIFLRFGAKKVWGASSVNFVNENDDEICSSTTIFQWTKTRLD